MSSALADIEQTAVMPGVTLHEVTVGPDLDDVKVQMEDQGVFSSHTIGSMHLRMVAST